VTRPRLRRPAASAVVLLAAALLVPAALHAQSAREVLQTALDAHQSRTEGIENYTVVQSVMGFETTTYFERQTVDGRSLLMPASRSGSDAGHRVPENPYRMYAVLADRAQLTGTEAVDGEETHVIEVTDLEGTPLQEMAGEEPAGFELESVRLWIDTDQHVTRKMVFEGTSSAAGGETGQARFTVFLEDYREQEGLLYPFRARVETAGLGGGMSEEERSQMRESMEKMRQQMENMSAQQRKMMERVMGGQLEKMEEMVTSGALDFTVEVKELRVNEGPPGGG
jgi:hypothetical protein